MKILPAFFFLLLFNGLKAQTVFHWQWQLANDTIQLTGRLNEEEPTVVRLSKESIRKDFAFLYRTIDELHYNQWAAYQKTVTALSKTAVLPFEEKLKNCHRIVIEMDSALLSFPVEFLHVSGQALAVFRPLVFTVAGFGKKDAADTLALHKGFLLRDPTSDPEDACHATFRRYPRSTYRSTKRINLDDFAFPLAADFALISAHGFADSVTLRGCVFAGEEPIKPIVFQNTQLKLVYIDGCQQGVNWAYIKALAQNGNAAFYLGPVVSNDAGESSTKTINGFFARLAKTADPVLALWQTRKALYRHYKPRLRGMDLINKSFSFRIYKL